MSSYLVDDLDINLFRANFKQNIVSFVKHWVSSRNNLTRNILNTLNWSNLTCFCVENQRLWISHTKWKHINLQELSGFHPPVIVSELSEIHFFFWMKFAQIEDTNVPELDFWVGSLTYWAKVTKVPEIFALSVSDNSYLGDSITSQSEPNQIVIEWANPESASEVFPHPNISRGTRWFNSEWISAKSESGNQSLSDRLSQPRKCLQILCGEVNLFDVRANLLRIIYSAFSSEDKSQWFWIKPKINKQIRTFLQTIAGSAD